MRHITKSGKILANITLILTVLTVFLSACAPQGAGNLQKASKSDFLFDTVVTVTLYGSDDTALIDECFEECRKYEKIFSRTDPESELYKLNAAGSMEVSGELLGLIEKALYYCRLSEGAFDITMGRISDMYGFSSESPTVPPQDSIASALESVGYENISISGNTVSISGGAAIDLGAIAKGYIADRLKEFLTEKGVESAIIDLGGNILCVGEKPGGSAFGVGIRYPFEDSTKYISTVKVRDKSVVTSGVYERSFTEGGIFYHHILDPETGYPVDNDILAVSVITPKSADGDALSTVLFSLGREKGLELAETLPDVHAVFVTDDYKLHYSEGFEKEFVNAK